MLITFRHWANYRMIRSKPIISRQAYLGFVSFIFAAAAVSWGATFLGINPVAIGFMTSDDSSGIRPQGLDYLVSLDGQILAGGLLYGVVLICFYWIYAEFLTIQHIPRNLVTLLLDFIALSFMAGAAAAWVNHKAFVYLAAVTVVLLFVRFAMAGVREHWEGISWWQRIMTHIAGVYLILIGFLYFSYSLGEWIHAGGQPIDESTLYSKLYLIVLVFMLVGILITNVHAFIFSPYAFSSAAPTLGVLAASEYGTPLPRLVPDYGIARSASLAEISSDVRDGERRFLNLLSLHSGKRTLAPHLSRVHSLRDVETQAFIMSHHANGATERQLRSMWVYLAHWFDDLFDYYFPERLARQSFKGDFQIDELLKNLDEDYVTVWRKAIDVTKEDAVSWNADLLETGMRRLILGGPLFSPKCDSDRRKFLSDRHRDLVLGKLGREGENSAIRELIQDTPQRHLNYTVKVVSEIWDSFDNKAKFSTSLLMNYFYSHSLLHHDFEAERARREGELSSDDATDQYLKTLDRASKLILELPDTQLAIAVKPVPMFFRCFRPVIQQEVGDSGLLNIYRAVLENDRVFQLTGCRPEDCGFPKST